MDASVLSNNCDDHFSTTTSSNGLSLAIDRNHDAWRLLQEVAAKISFSVPQIILILDGPSRQTTASILTVLMKVEIKVTILTGK